MFASEAYAQPAAAPAGDAQSLLAGPIGTLLPLVALFILFYFLLIRPQQRRLKAHQEMIGAVKLRDTAVTNGGLIGRVTKVEDAEVELEVAQGVRVRVVKSMLSDVRPHGQKPAND